jgi:hypothetical protein
MPRNLGGYLIRFDEQQRSYFLREVRDLSDGFSDALSSEDWSIRQWEVCGLMFEPNTITHWALARKSKRVVTGKVKVDFTEVYPTSLNLDDLKRRIGRTASLNVISSRAGSGGSIPPGTWDELKQAVGQVNADSLQVLQRLEALRDASKSFITRSGAEVVAQQKDAVGLALDAFDQTGQLKKQTLRGWAPTTETSSLSSFLDGIQGVRTIEDQLLARDAATFPDMDGVRHTLVGAVFGVGGRKLEVFNVNRTHIENTLGVDLLYLNDEFQSWTLVQYKVMEGTGTPTYRPDQRFDDELDRMNRFRQTVADRWSPSDGKLSFRLNGDGFFFKFLSRVQLEVLSDALLPGMYLPREMVQALLADPESQGTRGGRRITFDTAGRHLNNTSFADLLRDGWIGTRLESSQHISHFVGQSLAGNRSVVIARARQPGSQANREETLASLGL